SLSGSTPDDAQILLQPGALVTNDLHVEQGRLLMHSADGMAATEISGDLDLHHDTAISIQQVGSAAPAAVLSGGVEGAGRLRLNTIYGQAPVVLLTGDAPNVNAGVMADSSLGNGMVLVLAKPDGVAAASHDLQVGDATVLWAGHEQLRDD